MHQQQPGVHAVIVRRVGSGADFGRVGAGLAVVVRRTHDDITVDGVGLPLTISRRGGFAGVDDRVEIAADGSATLTTRGRPAAKVLLSAATVDELGRLVSTREFTGKVLPDVPTCNDGFEYEVATPSSTVTVHECGQPHGEPTDRIIAIAAKLLNG